MRVTQLIEKARRLFGLVWALSWFELYLEIFRHRHLSVPFLHTLPTPVVTGPAQAGGWLRSVLASSVLAPLAFAILSLLRRSSHNDLRDRPNRTPIHLAWSAMGCGIALAALGAINQLIWRPALVIDLTLRSGNAGFVVLGLALMLVGAASAYSARARTD